MRSDDTVIRYKLGRSHLAVGRVEGGAAAFDRVLALTASKPSRERASVQQGMARVYSDARYHGEAVSEARKALELDSSLREAYYDLNVFYLMGGDYGRADSVYGEATRRYGADSAAVARLRMLVASGYHADEARRIFKVHFRETTSSVP